MRSVLFVCHGNICRSTMAEFLLRDMLEKRGVKGIAVASAGTSPEELGNPVYHGTRRILNGLGIDCSQKRASQIRKDDYAKHSLLLGMDSQNVRNMLRMLGGDPDGKVMRLLDFSDHPRDIADPWYSGDFERTYRDVTEGLEALFDRWV